MTSAFQLRFPSTAIPQWAEEYNYDDDPVLNLATTVQQRGFLTNDDLLVICRWKSPRSQRHCHANSPDFLQEVTQSALSRNNERFRIEVLTLLDGVSWPTASVILHFFHRDPYPILDVRALWSLQSPVPGQYTFEFWLEYTQFCRALSRSCNVSMRTLDRALWQFSKTHQSGLETALQ